MKHLRACLIFVAAFALMASLPGIAAHAGRVDDLEALLPDLGTHSSGNPIYPDYIGGIYYDDAYNLIVQIVKDEAAKDPEYSRIEDFLVKADRIIIEYVLFPENELYAVMEYLDSLWTAEQRPDVFERIDGCALDTINNRVEIRLSEYNEADIVQFRASVLDSPVLAFVQSPGKLILLSGSDPTAQSNASAPAHSNSVSEQAPAATAAQPNPARTEANESAAETEALIPLAPAAALPPQITPQNNSLWIQLLLAGILLLGTGTIFLLHMRRSALARQTTNGDIVTASGIASRKQVITAVKNSEAEPRADLFSSIAETIAAQRSEED